MTRRIPCVLAAACFFTGCATASSRFYTLDPTATSDGSPAAGYGVAVGPVTLPPAVDRAQLVVRVAANRVELDEFNRWAAPLDDSIARTVAANLEALLGTSRVTPGSVAGFTPAYRVTIDVQQFESLPGRSATIDAVWAVHRTAGGPSRFGRTIAREDVTETSIDALAAAHSRALATISAEIAAAIRSEAASHR
jgi:uncharacterized lipoprotein YmbA